MSPAEIIRHHEAKIHTLETQIISYQAELNTYQKRCEQYAQAYDTLQEQVKELLRHRFGKKSERFVDPENPQLSLLEDNSKFALADAQEETGTAVAAYSRKKKQNSVEKEIPRRIEIIPVCDTDKQCRCGACKTVIRYETKTLLDHQPAVFEILEQRREVVACPNGCDGEIITASAPLHILPKVKATEAFLAFLVVSKCDDRQPLYHLEKQLSERHGMDCSRQTMARWVIDLLAPLQLFIICAKTKSLTMMPPVVMRRRYKYYMNPAVRQKPNRMSIAYAVAHQINLLCFMITTTNCINLLLKIGSKDLVVICM